MNIISYVIFGGNSGSKYNNYRVTTDVLRGLTKVSGMAGTQVAITARRPLGMVPSDTIPS